uniref:Peptidoglycan binding-like domain-containing protein n=1 Tax=Knipowitschia caucasica TaxID=637954 RepID=A0AAV2IX62_KNICA
MVQIRQVTGETGMLSAEDPWGQLGHERHPLSPQRHPLSHSVTPCLHSVTPCLSQRHPLSPQRHPLSHSVTPCLTASPPVSTASPLSPQRGDDWLSKFGYLPPPDPVTGQLQTKEALTRAIKAMQKFGGLKETGVLDVSESEVTVGRRRRSVLPPNKWNKRHLSWR